MQKTTASLAAMADADWGGHNGSRLGLDIGGTLAKLVFFESETRPSWCNGRIVDLVKSLGNSASLGQHDHPHGSGAGTNGVARTASSSCGAGTLKRSRSLWGEQDFDLTFYDAELGGRFHFLTFRSDQMDRFVALVEKFELHHDIREIFTTGGGAYKYAELFKQRLGVHLQPLDELAVVVKGIAWLVERPISQKICWLDDASAGSGSSETSPCSPRHFLEGKPADLFPFLLVNIGSGVSIVKVDGLNSFERVSGSAIGGGTFWGLGQMLCQGGCADFSEAGLLAMEGDASSLNLLVEDIYGGDYMLPSGAVLPGDVVASFFAKGRMSSQQTELRRSRSGQSHCDAEAIRRHDAAVLHTLTRMVSSNVCQIAYLNARLYGLSRVVFTGNFLRQNPVARDAIAAQMRRVSSIHQGQQFQALFLQHEGYFGALGSFLHNVQEQPEMAPISKKVSSVFPQPGKAARKAPAASLGRVPERLLGNMRLWTPRAMLAKVSLAISARRAGRGGAAPDPRDSCRGGARSPPKCRALGFCEEEPREGTASL